MSRRGTAVLAAALVLSAPAAAPGQSVGDEQYRDPFAGEDQPQDDDSQDGVTTPAPAPGPATPAGPTDSTAVEPTATVAGTLPRTGGESGWVALAGLLLVTAGAGLRRAART